MQFKINTILTSILTSLIISTLVFSVIFGLNNYRLLENLELIVYDWYILLKPRTEEMNPRICIITITEDDIRRLGFWPLTDKELSDIIEIINQSKPIAIGVDIFRDLAIPPGTEKLDSVFRDNHNIVGVIKFGEGGVSPHPALKNTGRIGFNDVIVDRGGAVRRGLLFLDDGKKTFFSFSLKLALLYLKKQDIGMQPDPLRPEYIKLGPTTIYPFEKNNGCYINADSRGYQFLLDFQERSSAFETFSLSSLYGAEVSPDKIKGRIVLIGVTAESVKDTFYIPLDRDSLNSQMVDGIVLHAHIISQILRFGLGESEPVGSLTQIQEYTWIWIWGLVGTIIGLCIRSPWFFSALTVALILGLNLTAYLSLLNNTWIPLVSPALAFVISSTLVTAYVSNREKKQRTTLMNLFSKHVSHQVAEAIWRQRNDFIKNGRPPSKKLTVTVMFSDLKGFASVAEGLDSQKLIDWLNTYMESMVQEIINHNGVVDDYAGDGIKANFGFPFPRNNEAEVSRDAINAVQCALAMEKEVMRLNTELKKQNLPEVGVRIGIYTGMAVAGALGGANRLKYTTVGDTVNIAARLESYDKEFAKEKLCRILISDTTLHYLNGQFKVEKIGEVYLKGKRKKVAIYHVLGYENEKNQCNKIKR